MNGFGTRGLQRGRRDAVVLAPPWRWPATAVGKAPKLLERGRLGARAPTASGEKGGVRASLSLLLLAPATPVRQGLAEEFANQMERAGRRSAAPSARAWTAGPSGICTPHQFTDPVVWGWGHEQPPWRLYNAALRRQGTGNYACYDSAAVDAHLDAALAATTVEESYPEWQAAQWDDWNGFAPQGAATWVWLCNVDHLYFKRDGLVVARQKPHPHGHGWSLVNNVDQWSWA